MRPELENIKLLEAYITGTLPEEQAIDTEIRLLWDGQWQQNLAAQRVSYEALREAGRQQLRLELKAVHTRLFH